MLRVLLVLFGVGLLVDGSVSAQKRPPLQTIALQTPDVELWHAALMLTQRERKPGGRRLAMVNESIPSEDIRAHLRAPVKDALIERLLERNAVRVRFPRSSRLPGFEVLDLERFVTRPGGVTGRGVVLRNASSGCA